MKFKELFTEAIITPENLNIKTSSVGKLNNSYNRFNIFFEPAEGLNKMNSTGNFNLKTKEINIQVAKNADLNMLNSVVLHELLHREQDKRSIGKSSEWIIKYGNKLNDYIARFNDRVDINTSTQKEFDKIKQMQNIFKLGNTYELMAYAYQFVKVRKEIGAKSASDIIKYINTATIIPINKQMKKYIFQYWEIREQL